MPSVHIVEGPTIWIIGDSYVRRGRDRAAETLGHNLGMAAHVQWFGRGGLRWSSLVPWLFRLLRGRSAPAVLLICCGSNDLGKVKSVDLVAAMKRDLLDLHRRYPSMDIFFSQLTDRRLWRDAQPGRINLSCKHFGAGEVFASPAPVLYSTSAPISITYGLLDSAPLLGPSGGSGAPLIQPDTSFRGRGRLVLGRQRGDV
uniref:SGNH hydrolase-type esterase domain-containing protein n=1 Tax=Knipowitschia caucasica TaxID=637954 RepID=A0AAV2MBQ4_KNICA